MFGDTRTGNERSGSSRKSKKISSDSEKPNKQPQRGLGVAQLEKIRLQMNYGHLSSSHLPFPNPLNQEEMRTQASYAPLMQSSASFTYSPPSRSSSSSSSYIYHPNTMMRSDDMESANTIYAQPQPWYNHKNGVLESQQYEQPGMSARPLLNHAEDSMPNYRRRVNLFEPMGSSSRNSESNDIQELDLELRL